MAYFIKKFKKIKEVIQELFQTQPKVIFEKPEVKINDRWTFSNLKRVVDKLNTISGDLIYDTKPKPKILKYYEIFYKINIPLAFVELIYYTLFKKQDLLGFIATGEDSSQSIRDTLANLNVFFRLSVGISCIGMLYLLQLSFFQA